MTKKEKEIREAVAKIGHFQGRHCLKMIDYIDAGRCDDIKYNVRDNINPDLLKLIDEFDALKFKEDLTVEEVDNHIRDLIRYHSDELHHIRDLIHDLEW